ncbi:DUF3343 domain-containing protein [Anaerovorax odorimutans]|uniref:DUF3343 domain-containing protein n=1 Tax=Anaerovorax odorimutans TaxID=109327 RepID=UPI00048945C5|nr:DUF3343 domain-containing protein [Anaerovorax odorimutans]
MKEYAIAFSSFYKAIYAQEKLQENHIRSTLKKLPPEFLRSCGYGLYLKTDSIQRVENILTNSQIDNRGVFII